MKNNLRLSVECVINENGRIQINKVQTNGKWIPVGQGRQWQDQHGRHVLIMLPNNEVWEIILRPDTLIWERAPRSTHLNDSTIVI